MLLFGGRSPSWPEAPIVAPMTSGPLADYVARRDVDYGWTVRRRSGYGTGRFAEVTLTSQRWHDVVWKHQLFVYKPAEVRDPRRCILFLSGDSWRTELEQPPHGEEGLSAETVILASLADRLGVTVAVLKQVPFQPLFADGLREDAAVAYTFDEFLKTGDPSWPLLVPMAKSAVRAMDCLGEFAAKEWGVQPTRFTLSGASKRGWTAWLTAAADHRVEALMPMVIDMLNMPQHLALQVKSWGRFSEQIHDYLDRGLHQTLHEPIGRRLLEIVDPYAYCKQITQPKLIVLGTNDRYWPLEALNLYWNDLVEAKYVVYVPNNGHAITDLDRVVGGLAALQRHVSGEAPLPKLAWDYVETADGLTLTLQSDHRPESVCVWTSAAATRDFRDAVWTATPVEADDGRYRFQLPPPTTGCAACFGEFKFADDDLSYHLSTTVRVVAAAKSAS